MRRYIITCVLSALCLLGVSADELRFSNLFNDGMMMQRGEEIPVWGWGAKPGKKVVVTLGTTTIETKAAKDGSWQVRLPKQEVSKPLAKGGHSTLTMTAVCGKQQVSVTDILVGDVFLCSGQSNMELPIRRCMDSVADLVKNYHNPNIRYIKFPHTFNYVTPNPDVPRAKWQDITPQNCAEVAGICYFMAQRLQENHNVPIGIINSSVGGTPVQSWTPRSYLEKRKEYSTEFKKAKYNNPNWVDSVRQAEFRAGDQWVIDMNRKDVMRISPEKAQWEDVNIFSASWVKKPQNGAYWFRKTFDIPAAQAGKAGTIRLGAMKDADSVFVNGKFVGTTSYQYPPRIYKIPAGLLREGANEVKIRLISEHGAPNFVGQKRYDVEVDGQCYNLGSDWQMAVGALMPEKQNYTYFVSGYTGLYNAMIAPLRDYPVKGVLWYQGEANMGDNAENYASMLSDMITSWREQWHNEMPLAIVELPYHNLHGRWGQRSWGIVQNQQVLASKQIPHAAYIDILDTGEPNDIHPQDKHIAGWRAAKVMERLVYGDELTAEQKKDGKLPLRLLNHWDNPNGTVERGFFGHSIWKWVAIPADPSVRMPDSIANMIDYYGTQNLQLGINGTVLNNVNAKPQMLSTEMLKKTKRIADMLRPYGIRVYLSVNFASPKALGDVATADPLDKDVVAWWQKKSQEIFSLIPDFGGFLVKANSEGEPGPMDYGRTHVDGANMLADALTEAFAKSGNKMNVEQPVVMWRAFVYSPKGGDRASQAYDEFVKFDGQFRDNVIIQIKNGPIDFQPREPLSPLFFALKKTKMMAELQITQEYTGHNVHTCFLAPEWREFIDTVNKYNIPLVGLAGVSNIGDKSFGIGNDKAALDASEREGLNLFSKANWYAFGMLANDTTVSSERIARVYLQREWSRNDNFVRPMTQLLLDSYKTLVDYMMPMGLHHIFAGGHHYGPEPWCYHEGWREDWLPRYYHRADKVGLGFNRTDHKEACATADPKLQADYEQGSGNAIQYPEPLRSIYNNKERCPESLLLWFHHVPWTEQLKGGVTLWDKLCQTYDNAVSKAGDFVKTWESMKPYVDERRYNVQLQSFSQQAADAWWWRDACLLYFQTFSALPFPQGSPAPHYDLDVLKSFNLGIDNYSSVPADKRPAEGKPVVEKPKGKKKARKK